MIGRRHRRDAADQPWSCGAQPFSYSRPHMFIASGSPWTCPSLVSRSSSNSDIADGDRSVKLLAFANCSDEVCKVCIRHGITPDSVRRGGFTASLEFAHLFACEIVEFVAIAIVTSTVPAVPMIIEPRSRP